MANPKDREAVDHLQRAAALLDGDRPHVATKIRVIANQLETDASARADYREGRRGHGFLTTESQAALLTEDGSRILL